MKETVLAFLGWVLMLALCADPAISGGVPMPFRIGGTVSLDGVQLTEATDDGLLIKVTKKNGSEYTDVNGNHPQDNDGLNSANWYLIDVPIRDSVEQPGGGVPSEDALLHVYRYAVEYTLSSPAGGAFKIGESGANQQINIVAQNVLPASLLITSPNGGESWQAGTPHTIQWTFTGDPGATVQTDLLKGGVFNRTITSGSSAGSSGNGSYNWTISSDQTPGSDYRIKISSTSVSGCSDTSDNDFTIVQYNYNLSVTKSGTGSGNVTSNPAGINCGSECNKQYAKGTSVTLTAAPDQGSTFTGWSGGGCSGTGTCTVPMNGDTTVNATFNTSVAAYTISGTVTSEGVGLSGVTINLTGAATKSTTTESGGNYSLSGLSKGAYTITPGKTGYTFTPQSLSVNVNGADVTGQNFTATSSGLPGKAILVSPSGAISTNTPTYTWNAVSNSTYYNLYVHDSTGYKIWQWYSAAEAGCEAGTGTCSLRPDVALATGSGYWNVQTWNANGNGPWSDAMEFTVALPNIFSISGTVTSGGFALPGVTVNLTGAATSTATTDSSGNYSFSGLANGAYTITPGKTGYTFSPPSRSVNVNGADVTGQNFTAPLAAATLVSPWGSIGSNVPTYTWNAVFNSTWYCLWVDDHTGNRISQWYTAAQAGCSSGIGTCSVTPQTALATGTGKWWVQTWDANGSGPWSDVMIFNVPAPVMPGKITLISPSGIIGTNTPTYAWNADPHSTWYYLWVNDRTGTCIQQWVKAADAGCGGGTGTCSVTPDIALAQGAASWWIDGWNPNGSGPWSDAMALSVPAPVLPGKVTLNSPSGTIGTSMPTYAWHADPYASWYYLWVDDSSGNCIKKWYKSAEAGCSGGTGTCSVSPGIALAAGSGKWWVDAWNPNGSGPWSNGMAFTINSTGGVTE
jgi:hypothetical protein